MSRFWRHYLKWTPSYKLHSIQPIDVLCICFVCFKEKLKPKFLYISNDLSHIFSVIFRQKTWCSGIPCINQTIRATVEGNGNSKINHSVLQIARIKITLTAFISQSSGARNWTQSSKIQSDDLVLFTIHHLMMYSLLLLDLKEKVISN